VIRFNNPSDGRQIAQKAWTKFAPGDAVIARVAGSKLLGGVIFQHYTGTSMYAHAAGFDPHWINPDMLWVCSDYAFVQSNCKVIFGNIPSCNHKTLEFAKKIGFKEIVRVPDAFPEKLGDLVFVRFDREDCRWLKIRPKGLVANYEGRNSRTSGLRSDRRRG
jgi:hypothetical protein